MLNYFENRFRRRLDFGHRTAEQYAISLRAFARFIGRDPRFDEPTAVGLVDWLLSLRGQRSARTINNQRKAVLAVWRAAWREKVAAIPAPDVPKAREPKRSPEAWTIAELGRLLRACEAAEPIDDWTGEHWRALVLTIYDSSLRIGCLLRVERSGLSPDGWLHVPGELQKHGRDTVHRLHPDTTAILAGLPPSKLLFPWPRARRALWVAFAGILTTAGLPAGRRDKFHRIRRTSYTQVYRALGPLAATQHAGHAQDLSAAYLDVRQLGLPVAADVIPRP